MRTSKSKSLVTMAAAVAALGLSMGAQAGAIDTYLTGVGVSVPDAVTQPDTPWWQWAPTPGSGVDFASQDYVGAYGYVGPGYGGQPYDLEALYVQRTGTQLIITGISGADLTAMPVGASGTCDVSSQWRAGCHGADVR